MAPGMEQTARICFPAARRVTDRFHDAKLAYEAVRNEGEARWEAWMRNPYRWHMPGHAERYIMLSI